MEISELDTLINLIQTKFETEKISTGPVRQETAGFAIYGFLTSKDICYRYDVSIGNFATICRSISRSYKYISPKDSVSWWKGKDTYNVPAGCNTLPKNLLTCADENNTYGMAVSVIAAFFVNYRPDESRHYYRSHRPENEFAKKAVELLNAILYDQFLDGYSWQVKYGIEIPDTEPGYFLIIPQNGFSVDSDVAEVAELIFETVKSWLNVYNITVTIQRDYLYQKERNEYIVGGWVQTAIDELRQQLEGNLGIEQTLDNISYLFDFLQSSEGREMRTYPYYEGIIKEDAKLSFLINDKEGVLQKLTGYAEDNAISNLKEMKKYTECRDMDEQVSMLAKYRAALSWKCKANRYNPSFEKEFQNIINELGLEDYESAENVMKIDEYESKKDAIRVKPHTTKVACFL